MPDPRPLPALPPAPLDRAALLAHLDACGFDTRTVDHPAVFTVAESDTVRDRIAAGMGPERAGAHTKNLFLRDRKNNHFLVTAEQGSAVDLKRLHKVIGGASRFSFGKPQEMERWLGVSPGSVTAFGVVNDRGGDVRFVLDANLLAHEWIHCHPLTNEATTAIRRDDLVALAARCGHEPLVADLSGAGLEA